MLTSLQSKYSSLQLHYSHFMVPSQQCILTVLVSTWHMALDNFSLEFRYTAFH